MPLLDAGGGHAARRRPHQAALVLTDAEARSSAGPARGRRCNHAFVGEGGGGVLDERGGVLLAEHDPVAARGRASSAASTAALRLGALGERRRRRRARRSGAAGSASCSWLGRGRAAADVGGTPDVPGRFSVP